MDESEGFRQWVAPEPRAVFLLVHGLGAHTGRWEALADFFLDKGISSYAVELRDFSAYHRDILRLSYLISKNNPSKKIFLVGESLGGLISFLLAIERPDLFNGLVCLSPAFANRLKLSLSDCVKIFLALFYDQKKQFNVPFDSSMCTRDIDYIKRMNADERESRSASAIALSKIILFQAYSSIVKKKLKTPVLFLSAGDDKIVSREKTGEIFNSLTVADKALIEYPDMYHSLSIELGKEKVFEDVLRWVDKRI